MLTYEYVARNPVTGERVKSNVQADSEKTAASLIRKEGLVVLDLTQSDTGGGFFASKFNHVPTKDKVLFSRQLSTLIDAEIGRAHV